MMAAPASGKDPVPESGDGPSRHAEHRAFINKGSRFMLLDNVSKVVEPLMVLLCAKLYAGGDWGLFKYYESLALLLTRLGSIGLDRGVVWIYARCADDAAFVRRFSRSANLVLALSLGIFGFVLLQHTGILPLFGRWGSKLPSAPTAQIAMFLASVPLQALTLLFVQSFLNKRALIPVMAVRNIAVPAAIYGPALALYFTPWKSIGLALPYLFGNLAGAGLAAFFFFRLFGQPLRAWSLSPSVSGQLLRFSLPLASTDMMMSFTYRLDMLLLGRYSGIHAVEVYSVIAMVSNTLRSLRQSFDGIMLSVFSAETSGRVSDPQKRNFNYATWMVTTIQLPFLFLALVFGREILGLISPAYADGYRVLVIATFFNLLITVGAFSGQLLVGLGKTFFIPASQAVSFLASVALNFLMVPRWGAEGAALATGLALFIGGMVAFAGIWRYSGGLVLQSYYLAPIAVDSLAFAVPVAMHFALRPPLPVDAALFAAGAAVYALRARGHWRRFNRRHA